MPTPAQASPKSDQRPKNLSLQQYLILRMREGRRASRHRNPLPRIALIFGGLVSLALALTGVIIALTYANLSRDLPSIDNLPVLLDPPNGLLLQPTRLYDRSGEHVLLSLENPGSVGRQYLQFNSITPTNISLSAPSVNNPGKLPQNLIAATIAFSDPYFWSHPGFSLYGIFQNDHPTLAQRLVSDLLLYQEPRGFHRALRERLLAYQITSRFGREKVLEWYLNNADYGRFAYGADAAALLYFGKSAADLSLGEATLLAGVSESPSLNPLDAPQAALERQKIVIQELLRYHTITPAEGIQAAQEELVFRVDQQTKPFITLAQLEPKIAPDFSKWVIDQLESWIPLERLERGGLRVITTLDYDLQTQVACSTEVQLACTKSPSTSTPISMGEDCLAARLLPTLLQNLESTQEISPSISSLQANAIVSDPKTGQILAMVVEPFSPLASSPMQAHPPGSLVTPFVYLTAFTRGSSPATLVWDIPSAELDASLQNLDGKYHGPIRTRIALANDYLIPAERNLSQVGSENVLLTARQLGILLPENPDKIDIPTAETYSSKIQPKTSPSIFSLFRQLNLVEISQAFGTLANQGILVGQAIPSANENTISIPISVDRESNAPTIIFPATLLRVEDLAGQVWLDWNAQQIRPILTPQLAYLMTDVLSDEAARWQSLGHPNALEIGRPAAVKIGRTPSGDSNWVVGYIPQRVVGVWMGFEEPPPPLHGEALRLLQKSTTGLWHALMQYASRDLPNQDWVIPSEISNLRVCDPSGMLVTKDCPNVVDEIFLSGNEPVQFDTLYRTLPVNRETGNMATMFTPPDLVEERTYLMFPPEASEWAKQAGVDTPPAAFDIVPAALPSWSGAQITSPAMFALVHGKVSIVGDASGADFSFYRFQVGEGPFPQSWFLVGEDAIHPVTQSELVSWDTTGLSGLYVVQLLVVRKDQSVERITTMVTVDNHPPEVKILYPGSEEEVPTTREGNIVLQTEVSDDLGIKEVLFYIDGRLYTTLIQAPFAISWSGTPGAHTLRVLATDMAGNTSESSVEFVVQ